MSADDATAAALAAQNLIAASKLSFFDDLGTTEQRIAAERKRSRTPAQRAQVRKRPPRVRTVQMGLRTTPAIKGLIDGLREKIGENATSTDVIEAAVIELARARGMDTEGA